MIKANISEIKAKFSYYVNLAIVKNEEIIICNHNIPIAKIVPTSIQKKSHGIRKLGVCKNKIALPKNFNNTSKNIIDSFYRRDRYL